MHFNNLWTVYHDLLTAKYIPSVGDRDHSLHAPGVTMMLILYAYFYSLVDDDSNGLNGFRIWRKRFPEEETAIAAVEACIIPFKDDLRRFRNRLGFHGSRTRKHEAPGLDLFANAKGAETLRAMGYFKRLGTLLLCKDLALQQSSKRDGDDARANIDDLIAMAVAHSSSA